MFINWLLVFYHRIKDQNHKNNLSFLPQYIGRNIKSLTVLKTVTNGKQKRKYFIYIIEDESTLFITQIKQMYHMFMNELYHVCKDIHINSKQIL